MSLWFVGDWLIDWCNPAWLYCCCLCRSLQAAGCLTREWWRRWWWWWWWRYHSSGVIVITSISSWTTPWCSPAGATSPLRWRSTDHADEESDALQHDAGVSRVHWRCAAQALFDCHFLTVSLFCRSKKNTIRSRPTIHVNLYRAKAQTVLADEIDDMCHLSRHDSDDKKWQTIRTLKLLCCFIFWLRNNIKTDHIGPPLVTQQVSNFVVVHFIGRLSLETNHAPKVGQLYRSSDVGLRHCGVEVSEEQTENVLNSVDCYSLWRHCHIINPK